MAKIVSIINHKGGVGKTATAANLGAALQIRGKRVLLIDMDAQSNLTDCLGVSTELDDTIYQAMRGYIPLPIVKNEDGLDIVPSCLDMSAIEMEIMQKYAREQILHKLISQVQEQYDYILIDCPPSLIYTDYQRDDCFGLHHYPRRSRILSNARNGQANKRHPGSKKQPESKTAYFWNTDYQIRQTEKFQPGYTRDNP